MTDIDKTKITQMIDSFLAGETSREEEQQLYAFFSEEQDLPQELGQYREMFGWYASLGALADTGAGTAETAIAAEAPKARILRMGLRQWMSIAAAIAVIFTLGFFLRPSSSTEIPDDYYAYEGSYIIRDGKKITDLKIVVPEIRRMERMVDESINAIDTSIREADGAFDASLESSYDMSDPSVKELIEGVFTN
ncbi:MAG: hypothetical protein NC212_06095 [Staphylococcus sp.]|nr:hypothetical protein [Staphylococcus sp.]